MKTILKKSLNYHLTLQKRKNFVIVPFGENGKLVKQILNDQFGIKEKYIVDNYLSKKREDIYDIHYLENDYQKDPNLVIIIALSYKTRSQLENYIQLHQQITKFASLDRIADLLSPSSYINPWNHFIDMQITKDVRHHTTECISREIYRNHIEGAISEVGVYRGNTAKWINILFPDRNLYLFDTFSGFNQSDLEQEDLNHRFHENLDFSNTSVNEVLEKMSYPKNCIIKKGYFPDSAKNINEKFAFVRLDMDLYNPIYAGLEFFYPRISRGGYIAIHDCRSKNFDGAREALLDFCKKNKVGYMCMPDTLGTAVITKGF